MRAVCYIPGIDCLVYQGVRHWVTLFERRADQSPTDVVLPAFTAAGASYSSRYAAPVERLGDQNTLPHWLDQTRSLLSDAKVWASIEVTLPTLSNDLIALRDQWDQAMGDACVVNPRVREILGTIFNELSELGVNGVVLDMCDAFPNSTSDRYPMRGDGDRPLQNTCFCNYCLEALRRDTNWAEGVKPFRSLDRSLSRFVLKPATAPSDGASWNDIKDAWLASLDGGALADFAEARGFAPDEDDVSRQDAVKLLRYLVARAKITAMAAKRLGESAVKEGLETAIVLGSSSYDMSQNVNLKTLIEHSAADEYWAPSFEPAQLDENGPVLLRFLSERGSYFLNALFQNLDIVSRSRTSELTGSTFRQLSKNAIGLTGRDDFDKGQCAQISLFPGLYGFVGAPFWKSEFIDLINAKVNDGSLHDAVRQALVTQLQSGATKAGIGVDATHDDANLWS